MSSDEQRENRPPHKEDDRGADSASSYQQPPRVDRPGDPEPFSLEESESIPTSASSKELSSRKSDKPPEKCPNCGAIMPDRYALVCLRCGYDQKTLRVQQTRIAKHPEEVEEEDEDESASAGPPIVQPGRGDLWLPLTLAGISIFALLVGHLTGTSAFFSRAMIEATGADGIDFVDRLEQFASAVVLIALWTGCGLAGLFLLAQTVQRVFGDLTLAAARMLGVIAVIRLATFIDLPSGVAEWIVECLVQGAAFLAVSILLFALKPRDGLVLGGFSLLAWVALWVSAQLITWVAG